MGDFVLDGDHEDQGDDFGDEASKEDISVSDDIQFDAELEAIKERFKEIEADANKLHDLRHLTDKSPVSSRPQTQIDHIAISYRWRGSITDCRSFWNTFVDSDHALVRSRFALRFPGSRKVRTNRTATERLADPDVRRTYKNRILEFLPSAPPSDVNSYWDEIATSLHSAGNFACGTTHPGALKHRISDRTLALLKSRRNIPAGPEHNPMRRAIRRQEKVSLRSDCELWWTQKANEMEGAQKAGNARRLFQLIRATSPRKRPVSESIKRQNGTTILNEEERLDRWAEYFEQQMSWPPAGTHLQPTGEVEPWTVNVEPPTASEVYDCICSLKRHRAPGPDDLPPALFKDGGEVLSQRLSDLFACIWETESVPDNWGESVCCESRVVPGRD
ncbi:hypothetical protein T265_09401 [Opisthorchis viverrini]|uniref:Uncharacterized protein n=1 Tax=Opisthorchis viverrini TaxID=6198 RepID=A0A074Z5W6_OPIVI|nr:hypothetical protein T265_09401 [Opisthorchis viverrini]KER22536.1 hypothetical protein T265_09401 [Opisthorchis viverrini]